MLIPSIRFSNILYPCEVWAKYPNAVLRLVYDLGTAYKQDSIWYGYLYNIISNIILAAAKMHGQW